MTTVTYTSSGTFTVPAGVTTLDHVFVVAGGGGGGRHANGGGGGGAGGCIHQTSFAVTPGAVLTVTVGAGGAAQTVANTDGYNGASSVFDSLTAVGGGGGGGPLLPVPTGGSGGGGGGAGAGNNVVGGVGTAGQGNQAGNGFGSGTVASRAGGGGGGAGAVGGNAGSATAGAGGAGVDWSSWLGTGVGVAGLFGGGGGGSKTGTGVAGAGGSGGGGVGSSRASPAVAAGAGVANTGGGGGAGAGHVTSGATDSAAGGTGFVAVIYTATALPNVPTSVAVTDVTHNTVELSWSAPSGGGPVTSYDVRLDGGTPVTGVTSPHTFTGLTAATPYDVEVRAVGPGGVSSWVLVSTETLPNGPTVDWHADVRVGSHVWSIDSTCDTDPDEVNVLAGATFTWAAPDDVGWPPPLHTCDRDVITLSLFAPEADDFADIRRGDVVRFTFTPLGYSWDAPLVDFAGRLRAVEVVDRDTTGAYLQLTAVDHSVTLQDWLFYGSTQISDPTDTYAEVLARIAYVMDVTELAEDHDMVPGGVADPLDPGDAGDYQYPAVVGVDWNIDPGPVSAFDMFARYGFNMMPVPVYDATTGVLDSTQPFVIVPLDPEGMDYVESEVDACNIPTASVSWQRDYTPNTVQLSTENVPRWAGQNYAVPLPEYAEWNLILTAGDDELDSEFGTPDVNTLGIANELPEPGPWGPYTFTILGWKDPPSVAGWLTYPARVLTYVTITGIEANKNPNGETTVSGMLRPCTWTMGENGRWVIDAGMRRSRGWTFDDA